MIELIAYLSVIAICVIYCNMVLIWRDIEKRKNKRLYSDIKKKIEHDKSRIK